MKKILILLFVISSFVGHAQSPIVGGNGQCVTQGNPNLNALFNNPTTKDICYRIYDETNNVWYSFDATKAAGAKYVSESKYVQTFLIADWVVSGGTSTIAILGTAHNKGVNPKVIVRETIGGVSSDIGLDIAINDTTGEITLSITAGAEFNGKVIIY